MTRDERAAEVDRLERIALCLRLIGNPAAGARGITDAERTVLHSAAFEIEQRIKEVEVNGAR